MRWALCILVAFALLVAFVYAQARVDEAARPYQQLEATEAALKSALQERDAALQRIRQQSTEVQAFIQEVREQCRAK